MRLRARVNVSVDEVAERLGKDSSTVRRQLYELEDKGACDWLRWFKAQVLLSNEPPRQDIGEALCWLAEPSEGAVTAFTSITHPLGILSLVMISLNSFTTSANADLRVGVNLMTM